MIRFKLAAIHHAHFSEIWFITIAPALTVYHTKFDAKKIFHRPNCGPKTNSRWRQPLIFNLIFMAIMPTFTTDQNQHTKFYGNIAIRVSQTVRF